MPLIQIEISLFADMSVIDSDMLSSVEVEVIGDMDLPERKKYILFTECISINYNFNLSINEFASKAMTFVPHVIYNFFIRATPLLTIKQERHLYFLFRTLRTPYIDVFNASTKFRYLLL